MEPKTQLPSIVKLILGSGTETPENLRMSQTVMEEGLQEPLHAEFFDDYQRGIEYCQERLAAMEQCVACGAVR